MPAWGSGGVPGGVPGPAGGDPVPSPQTADDADDAVGHKSFISAAVQTGFCDWSAKYFAQPVMKVTLVGWAGPWAGPASPALCPFSFLPSGEPKECISSPCAAPGSVGLPVSKRGEVSRGSRRVSEGGTDTAQGKSSAPHGAQSTKNVEMNEERSCIQMPQLCLVALQRCPSEMLCFSAHRQLHYS